MRLLLSGIIALREGELRVRLDDAPRRANAATNLGGKNVNRYPASKDSDDWGVTPDEGYAVALGDDELQKKLDYVGLGVKHRRRPKRNRLSTCQSRLRGARPAECCHAAVRRAFLVIGERRSALQRATYDHQSSGRFA